GAEDRVGGRDDQRGGRSEYQLVGRCAATGVVARPGCSGARRCDRDSLTGGPPAPPPGSASVVAQVARSPVGVQPLSNRSCLIVTDVPPWRLPAPMVSCTRTVSPMFGKFGVGET